MKVWWEKFTIGKLDNPNFKLHLFWLLDVLPNMQVPWYKKIAEWVQHELTVALQDIQFETEDFFPEDGKTV
jgi:hypothetical protein